MEGRKRFGVGGVQVMEVVAELMEGGSESERESERDLCVCEGLGVCR